MSPWFLMRVIARLFRVLSWPFAKITFSGGARIHEHPNWVMAANHRSFFDFPTAVMGLVHYGWDSRIMIAAEFFDVPVVRWAVRAINAIPVYRKTDPRGALSAAVEALRSGDSICIMPEGTVTWFPDRPLLMADALRTGVSRLAVESETPVLVIAIVGSERIWPKGRTLPRLTLRRRHVICKLADEPLVLEGDDHRANAAKVKATTERLILEATHELRALDPTYLADVDLPALPDVV